MQDAILNKKVVQHFNQTLLFIHYKSTTDLDKKNTHNYLT